LLFLTPAGDCQQFPPLTFPAGGIKIIGIDIKPLEEKSKLHCSKKSPEKIPPKFFFKFFMAFSFFYQYNFRKKPEGRK